MSCVVMPRMRPCARRGSILYAPCLALEHEQSVDELFEKLREIDWLTDGTGSGDFRLFYRASLVIPHVPCSSLSWIDAGHVEQRRTTSKTERDSMDEGSLSTSPVPYFGPHFLPAAIVTVDAENPRQPRKNLVFDNVCYIYPLA